MVSVVSRRLEKQPGRFVDGTGTLQLAARVAVPSTERPTEIGHWSKNQEYGVGPSVGTAKKRDSCGYALRLS